MIVRDGLAASFLVKFPTGTPTTVSWSLRNDSGVLGTGTVTPDVGAISANILISDVLNTLSIGYIDYREVSWSYTVDSAVTNGEVRYLVEARLPIGIAADGVRAKLGVSAVDVPDTDINLVKAFLTFQNIVTDAALTAAYDGGLNDAIIRDAVEALAAKQLIPSMAVRVALSEESGTDKFKRQPVDWLMVGLSLEAYINDGLGAVIDGYDPTTLFGDLFVLASPATDAITGA